MKLIILEQPVPRGHLLKRWLGTAAAGNYDTSYQRFCGRNLTGKTPDATARNVNRKHRFPSVWYSQTDIQWDSGQANRLKIWAETSTFSSDFFVCLQEKETGGECASGQEGQHMIGVNKDRRLSHIAKVTWINDHHVMRASLLLNGSKAIAYCSSGFLEAGKRVDTAVRNKIERKSTKKSIAVLYRSRDWTRVASMLFGK